MDLNASQDTKTDELLESRTYQNWLECFIKTRLRSGKNPRELTAAEISELLFINVNYSNKLKDDVSYIKKKILELDINGAMILDTNVVDLLETLGFQNENMLHISFVMWRTVFRLHDFKTRSKIIVEELNKTKSLNWDEVCQLLEEQVTPNNMIQRSLWYQYIEEQNIDGEVLFEMNCDTLIQALNFNVGQKTKYKKLIAKIKCGTWIAAPPVNITKSTLGVLYNGNGGNQATFGEISAT